MAATGAVLVLGGVQPEGAVLVLAAAIVMVLAAAALLIADRRRARLSGFLAQAVPTLVVLAALALG